MIQPVVFKEAAARLPRKRIAELVALIAEEEADPLSSGRVHLIFTTDAPLRRLNRDYRSIDRSTDVLSFNLEKPTRPRAVFGEIYISVPTARRQAKEYGGTLDEELLRLVCHGILHLFGYDHHRKREAARMRELEEKYLPGIWGK